MLPPESSLARTVASLDASSAASKLPDGARGALHALAEGPDVERAGRALDALRACGARSVFEEVAGALGHSHRDIVLALALPGARWPAGLDVHTSTPLRYEPDWHGDVFVSLPFRVPGAVVSLGTGRGVRALASLDDGACAAIVELDLLSGAHAEVDVLAALAFPSVRKLSPNDAPARGVAALIRRCPALEDCSLGKLVAPEVIDALAGAANLASTYLDGPRDADLVRLAALPRLAEVVLGRSPSQPEFGVAGLGALARGGPLRSLSVSYARVDDAELSVIAEQTALEALFAARGSYRDTTKLAALGRLRKLDLSGTSIGDVTARALATLPALEELDLTDTHVGADGVRALGAVKTLRRLGLAWTCSDEVTRAAKETFGENVVEWSDYFTGGGLWGPQFSGP